MSSIFIKRAFFAVGLCWGILLAGQTLRATDATNLPTKTHWAYVKPGRPESPQVKNSRWVRNPIDAFVLARLEKENLKPSPEAARVSLLRSVSLDLTGLPPTIAEIDAFTSDKSKDAYEKLVDRLLASPHYGEKWARLWLDLARYADTHGYEKDPKRSMWPYRDWVINAFNENMPFDEFTIEQVAGDLLPNATEEQKVASGFHRNTMFNTEGGVDPEQSRVETIVDRVNTTATVWLGSTLACAQCHTHKYDPFTITEYYRMFAFLNNQDEPQLSVPSAAQTAQEEKLKADIAHLDAEVKQHKPELDAAQKEWEPKFARILIENATAEASNTPAAIRKIVATPAQERTEPERVGLTDYFLAHSPAQKALRDELAAARKQQIELKYQFPTTLVMSVRKEPRETHIMVRGNFLNQGDKVTPGVPSRFAAVTSRCAAQPPHARAVAGLIGKSAHSAGDDESVLGAILRSWHRRDRGGLWHTRRAPDASRIARLARYGIHPAKMGHEGDA